jgi:hypothetical protein
LAVKLVRSAEALCFETQRRCVSTHPVVVFTKRRSLETQRRVSGDAPLCGSATATAVFTKRRSLETQRRVSGDASVCGSTKAIPMTTKQRSLDAPSL